MPTPLDPIVSEFATVEEAEAYDVWFREKVRRSMADTRPRIPHDQVMAEMEGTVIFWMAPKINVYVVGCCFVNATC